MSFPVSRAILATYSSLGGGFHMSRMKMTVPISQGHRRDEIYVGLPWWLSGKESACQCRRHGFNPWSEKITQAAEQLSPNHTIEPAP